MVLVKQNPIEQEKMTMETVRKTMCLRKWFFKSILLGSLAVGLSAAIAAAAKPPAPEPTLQYQLIDLGAEEFATSTHSHIIGINADGVMLVGYSRRVYLSGAGFSGNYPTDPYKIVSEQVDGQRIWMRQDPEIPEGPVAVEAMCINDSGWVVGIALFQDDPMAELYGRLIVWDAEGQPTFLEDIALIDWWEVGDMNNNFQIVASGLTADRYVSALVTVTCQDDGIIVSWVDLGCNAQGMNESGEVVGTLFGGLQAVLLRNAGTEGAQLITLPVAGSERSAARDINESGVIVGTAHFVTNGQKSYTRAFMWQINDAGTVTATDLGAFPGIDGVDWYGYTPYGINDTGRIVGTCSYYAKGNTRAYKGFVRENEYLWDLETLMVNRPAGINGLCAFGINNNGWIIGEYRTDAAGWRNCVFIPVSLEQAGITVVPVSGLITTEAGGKAVFEVVLNTQPTSEVAIPITSSNEAEGVVYPDILIFDPDTWDVPQTVTITGVDDDMVDGDVSYTVWVGPTVSDDPVYEGLSEVAVSVVNRDDEVPSGPTIVSVSNISYSTIGGKHLRVSVELKNNLGMLVSNASVSATLYRNSSSIVSWTGTTGSDGKVTFAYNNAPSGTYTTSVTQVQAVGLSWDGQTPDNTFTK